MRFLLVDRITRVESNSIEGERFFGSSDPFQYSIDGQRLIAPGAVSEAIGQLASWLCLKLSKFRSKPVFLFADHIENYGNVPAGSLMTIKGHIDYMDHGVIRFSGQASADGRVIQTVRECHGYLMPLSDLEDPTTVLHQYRTLTDRDAQPPSDDDHPYKFNDLVDEVLDVVPHEMVMTSKVMKVDEPFYKDHFPRMPVTPVVILSEMITTATGHLFEQSGMTPLRSTLRSIHDLKIRQFVRPGDRCVVVVHVDHEARDGRLRTLAEISTNGRRILRGQYEYEIDA